MIRRTRQRIRDNIALYIAFLATGVGGALIGIALMTVTAIGVCTEALR